MANYIDRANNDNRMRSLHISFICSLPQTHSLNKYTRSMSRMHLDRFGLGIEGRKNVYKHIGENITHSYMICVIIFKCKELHIYAIINIPFVLNTSLSCPYLNVNVAMMVKTVSSVVKGGGVAQWGARLARNMEVVGSSPISSPVVSLSKNFTVLLSTCCFLQRNRAGFHNQTKLDWGIYGRLT